MFRPPFHTLLKEKRLSAGFTQKEAAEICGLKCKRWSNLERGYRYPNDKERKRIGRLLRLGNTFVAPPGAVGKLLNSTRALAPNRKPFFPRQDRPTFVRFRAGSRRHPVLIEELTEIVTARPDFAYCEFVCNKISCDSSLETLFLLYLMARHAAPGFFPPSALGRTPNAIVDDRGRTQVGLRPRPCLVFEKKFYFFQVSFSLSRIVRVDILRWNDGWSVLELNGAGHDGREDWCRKEELGIDVTYLSEADVVELCERLLRRSELAV